MLYFFIYKFDKNMIDPFLLFPIIIVVLCSIFIHFWKGVKVVNVLTSISIIIYFLLVLFYFVANSFTGIGVNESVFFHLHHAMDAGLKLFKTEMIFLVLLLSLLILWGIWYGFLHARKIKNDRGLGTTSFRYTVSAIVLFIVLGLTIQHPSAGAVYTHYLEKSAYKQYPDFAKELRAVDVSKSIDQPNKNFIYIYVESLERTFMNPNRFPNLLPNLTTLEANSLSVHGIKQAPIPVGLLQQ